MSCVVGFGACVCGVSVVCCVLRFAVCVCVPWNELRVVRCVLYVGCVVWHVV